MTRKNYEEIADIIRDEGYIENGIYISDYRKLISKLCKYFKGDNNAFIAKKFRDSADSRKRKYNTIADTTRDGGKKWYIYSRLKDI